MDEQKPKKCLLDLVPDGPRYSEVFSFGEPARKYKFRLLDTAESMWCVAAAQRQVLSMLRVQFPEGDTALTLMMSHGPNADLHTWWQELFALQAALCNEAGAPVAEGSSVERAQRLADVFSPIERFELAQLYGDFADEYDPLQVSDDEIEEIIADVGPLGDPEYWRRYGSSVLRRYCRTMARRIAQLEMQLAQLQPEEPDTSPTPKSEDG
jgi:hypothetical protein